MALDSDVIIVGAGPAGLSAALVLGLGAAVRYALHVGVEDGGARAWKLAAALRERLEALPRVRVLDRGPTLSAIVTVHVEGRNPAELVRVVKELTGAGP